MLVYADRKTDSDRHSNHDRGDRPEGSRESRKLAGVVYTPKVLSDYVARKVTQLYFNDQKPLASVEPLRILDPACGKGELLESIRQCLTTFDLSRPQLDNTLLFGIDVDKTALQHTNERMRRGCTGVIGSESDFLSLRTNSLIPLNSRTSRAGWVKVKREFAAPDGFDIIIANPPWGADTSKYHDRLSPTEFTMLRGQFDSSDLFLESAIANLRDGGYLAFIVPDSLFSQEREPLRKLLIHQTEIRFIARLGEKFFGGINRACAIIICKKTVCKKERKIQCFRLTPTTRREILSGDLKFDAAEKQLSHFVDPSRFLRNDAYRFDIDLSAEEEKIVQAICSADSTLADQITSSRGVELSKKGRVFQCPSCKCWAPYPRSMTFSCSHCGKDLLEENVYETSIIATKRLPGYRPIIVGESVSRYRISRRYWIDAQKLGISYKNKSNYKPPKIVVRKTGVGLSVAIDYTNAMTNQVVYVLRVNSGNDVPLEFYLGLLASRAAYYYIAKAHGETEWRTHPYLTQTQILQIPVPSVQQLRNQFGTQVRHIVRILRKYQGKSRALSNEDDAAIERMIAHIYGLHQKDYILIFRAINEVEDLIPIRALKSINVSDVFSG